MRDNPLGEVPKTEVQNATLSISKGERVGHSPVFEGAGFDFS
jgi:hypothetical protein